MIFSRGWPCSPDDIEVIPWEAQIESLHERTRRKFGCHKHVAENTDPLSSNHGLDSMQLLPKAEMLHLLEIRQIAPLKSAATRHRCHVGGSMSDADQ